MKKCTLAILLALSMLFSLLPVTAFAEEEDMEDVIEEPMEAFEETGEVGVWIKGVKATDENCTDILGDGKFSYEEETKTLTVKNGARLLKPHSAQTASAPEQRP